MERRKLGSPNSTSGVLIMSFLCLSALSIGAYASAESRVTLRWSAHEIAGRLAHAGHEWQGWPVPSDQHEGAIHGDVPRGYPVEEPETPASHKPKKGYRSDESKTLVSYVSKADLSLAMIIFAMGSALFLGAAHALSPGHGKTMVAAYLIGCRGTRRDAVLLGAIVTFTHVISVLLLGLLCLFLAKSVASQKLFPWIGVISGTVIFLVGYWMLARRALGYEHGHSHHTPHHGTKSPPGNPGPGETEASCVDEITAPTGTFEHHHHGSRGDLEHHEHYHGPLHGPGGNITRGGLVSLGLAAGMVPCPTALVILLSAISFGRVGFGLLLIIFFSLGLAAVLIVIGLLTVKASRFVDRFSEQKKWIQAMPVFSAGVVMIVGIGMAFNSLLAGGILTINY